MLAVATLLSLGACSDSPDETPASTAPSTGSYSSGNAVFDEIVNNAPVASQAILDDNPWASAVREAGVLRVGGLIDSPLFWETDPVTGTVTGFDAGFALLLSRYIFGDVAIEVVPVTASTREQALENGSVDVVIAQYAITPERLEQVQFSGPYYLSGSVMLTTSNMATAPTRVAVMAGSAQATMTTTGITEILGLPTHPQCLSALREGSVEGYLTDESLAIAVWASDPALSLGERITTPADAYGIALGRSSDGKLFVDSWLNTLMSDGTWTALWETTIGQAGGQAPQHPALNSAGNNR